MRTDRNTRNTESDLEFENRIRPQELSAFSGQDKIVDNLKIFIKAALMRGDSLDHVLLHGPPGLGKTTLANIIAREMGAQLKVTSGPVLDKPGDLAGLPTNLDAGAVFPCTVHFKYNANGGEYKGKKFIGLNTRGLNVGEKITVYYDGSRPSKCLLKNIHGVELL